MPPKAPNCGIFVQAHALRMSGIMKSNFVLAALVCVSLFGSVNARAEDGASTPEAAPKNATTRWYGYQNAISDATALGLLVGGVMNFRFGRLLGCGFTFDRPQPCSPERAPDNSVANGLFVASAGVYALGSPVIHAVHGRWSTAGISLGARVAPVLLGAALAAAGPRGERGETLGGVGAGIALLGPVAAMIIDDIFLAREPSPPKATAFTPNASVHYTHDGGSVTLGAAF
jgi:hypothetical protein